MTFSKVNQDHCQCHASLYRLDYLSEIEKVGHTLIFQEDR